MNKITRTFISACAIATSLLMASSAMADNCYIMVHGHGTQGNVKSGSNQPALDYWRDSHFEPIQKQ